MFLSWSRTASALLLILIVCLGCTPVPSAGPVITLSDLLSYGAEVDRTLNGPNEAHVWAFAATAGDQIAVSLQGEGITPALGVYFDGQSLASIPAGSYRDRVTLPALTLPASGTYEVRITQSEAASGSYRLQVDLLAQPTTPVMPTEAVLAPTLDLSPSPSPPPLATLIPLPLAPSGSLLRPFEPVRGEINAVGEVARFTILGRAGDIITLGIQLPTQTDLDPVIELYAPSGDLLAESSEIGNARPILSHIVLPATGAYIVFVGDAAARGLGSFEIGYGNGYTLAQREQGLIAPDVAVQGNLDAAFTRDVWALELAAGDVISAAAVVEDSSALDPFLSLVDSEGRTLRTDDNSGGGRNAALRQVVIPQAGRYFLAVAPAVEGSQGIYTLIWRYEARGTS